MTILSDIAIHTIDETTVTLQSCAHRKHDVTGTIPATWEQAGAFPVLQTLYLSNTLLAGTLPSAWGSQAVLHELQNLTIQSCNFTGKPAVIELCACGSSMMLNAVLMIG